MIVKSKNHDGLQWMDASFCSRIFDYALKMEHPEQEAVFEVLDGLAEASLGAGVAWLDRIDISSFLKDDSNYFIDDSPELFFNCGKLNLMADALGHSSEVVRARAHSYFSDPKVRDTIFSAIMHYELLPRRRQAINKFYEATPHFLDTFEPLIDAEFTESDFVKQLPPERLADMEAKQLKREQDWFVRIPRLMPTPSS